MFLIYAAINKGIAVGTASLVSATVYSPTDVKTEVMLKDDGVCMSLHKSFYLRFIFTLGLFIFRSRHVESRWCLHWLSQSGNE